MARYLITGVAGFIASKVAELLLNRGHEVVAVDNLNDAYDVHLKQWRLKQLCGRPGFCFQYADISDRRELAGVLSSAGHFDAIINLAARAGVRASLENPWVYIETNITGTLNLLEYSRTTGVSKFLLASTSSLYGDSNERPYREDCETSRPISPYAASKKGAEALCFSYHEMFGIDVTVVRYFTVYGPAGRPDMLLFRLVQRISEGLPVTIYGDGSQERDFTYVDDIARGTIAALKPLGYQIINLGSDCPITVSQCLRTVEEVTGKEAIIERKPVHPADVFATWADISRARQLLNWEPKVMYRDGITNLVNWYYDNREWARHTDTN